MNEAKLIISFALVFICCVIIMIVFLACIADDLTMTEIEMHEKRIA